ncbi:hypothetical protein DERF_007775 [Dermatophagoides farinae]|uniref:Uncharacterized protein n=1 Tax=Dermatophagoides farinae TaxID=6954 RepID=A0A922L4U0_DERFA|nr:hypothetical protein DERF_007775 [Dermatophagoides farinae]
MFGEKSGTINNNDNNNNMRPSAFSNICHLLDIPLLLYGTLIYATNLPFRMYFVFSRSNNTFTHSIKTLATIILSTILKFSFKKLMTMKWKKNP